MARLPSRTPDAPAAPAAYVAVPATWLVFDHFTHTLVLWGSGSEPAQIDARLDRYAATLLEQRPELAGPIRALEPVRRSLTRRQYVDGAVRVKEAIREGEVYQLQLGVGRNDLGAVCDYGSVSADELLQIERCSHVMHIVSALSGSLREYCDALDLFRAAFPAGTVTGTPMVQCCTRRASRAAS